MKSHTHAITPLSDATNHASADNEEWHYHIIEGGTAKDSGEPLHSHEVLGKSTGLPHPPIGDD